MKLKGKYLILSIFFITWFLWGIAGIINNYQQYNIISWLITLSVLLSPVFIAVAVLIVNRIKKSTLVIENPRVSEVPTEYSSDKILYGDYIDSGNTIIRIDGKPITDEDVPYLIQTGYEKAIEREKSRHNPKFHRTQKEDHLSYNFTVKYKKDLCKMEQLFKNSYREAYDAEDLDAKIKMYEIALIQFQAAKKFCYSKGKGGEIYFQDMWEYMHIRRTPAFHMLI